MPQPQLGDTEDGVVVGFGAATGEDDFLRAGADQGGDLFAGGFDGGAGLLAKGVDGGGVAVLAGEIGKHGVEDFGIDGGGGVVIEVDAVHGAAFSIGRASTRARDVVRQTGLGGLSRDGLLATFRIWGVLEKGNVSLPLFPRPCVPIDAQGQLNLLIISALSLIPPAAFLKKTLPQLPAPNPPARPGALKEKTRTSPPRCSNANHN